MVHLSIAKRLIDAGYDTNNISQFYLGNISPDAIHMRQNSDRLLKNNTHLIPPGKRWAEIDEDDFLHYILDFISENSTKTDVDFLWGYCIHILTDMYWTKWIYLKFAADYKNDPTPIQEERPAYYNDTDILDQVLYNECDWKASVWQCLQSAKYNDFLDLLSAQEIESWNNLKLHWFDSGVSQHKNPIRYITKPDIENFISSCSETLWKKLTKPHNTM